MSLGQFCPPIEKVEFKYTPPSEDEGKVRALLEGVRPQKRTVYFFDTPKLELDTAKVVVRGRTTAGEDDAAVKLRPAEPTGDEPWRGLDGVEIEADIVGTRRVDSAKLGDDRKPGALQAALKTGDLGPLFKQEQEQFLNELGFNLDDLKPFGPINARVWELPQLLVPFKVSIEEWVVPNGGPSFLELSFKVKVEDHDPQEVAQDFRGLLKRLGLNPDAEQGTKTKAVLDFFKGA